MQQLVAVVTGAGRLRGIGRMVAIELARGGCDVVLTGTGGPRRFTTVVPDGAHPDIRAAVSCAAAALEAIEATQILRGISPRPARPATCVKIW